ncbi:MAG: DUF3043 domain-containing protein [Mycobacteriaceae bacterium]|nr:DUF3043 domain-containing protein [Mycobacteriaceae bacterium]MBV9639607.1 DUF3043 domain-containing protein [Mycobacteriaceae bacterium]
MHPKLAGVSLLGRKKGADAATAATQAEPVVADDASPRKTTAPKGRPTPKRDAAKRRGPVVPAPMTAAEARRRRKEMGGPKLTRDERRAEKTRQRAQLADRREKMMAGDEAYLLPRDRGPVRRYVRDVVDARRNVLGLFMPAALALIFVMLAVPQVQFYISPAMLVLVAIMAVDGLFLARKVAKMVDVKFPANTESRWKLGLYAASRASQLRRMRAPRPRVSRGDDVT